MEKEESEDKKLMVEWERYKCELEKWKTQRNCSLSVAQQVNLQGQGALKSALWINGGASVAMLAFVGTTINNDCESVLQLKLCVSMLLFIFGTFSAAVAFGATYICGLVQNIYYDEENKTRIVKWFWILNGIAILLVLISYGLFATGSLKAYFAFTSSLS
jgi:hypothetical protein